MMEERSMPQHIPVVPVALETGSWPTFHLTGQERLDIVHGRGVQRAQNTPPGPLLNPIPAPPLPQPFQEPAPVIATPVAGAGVGDLGPGGVPNASGTRTMDAQGHMVGPTTPSAPPPQYVSPGNINADKPPKRQSGPNLPGAQP
jgi:hypothetical protein